MKAKLIVFSKADGRKDFMIRLSANQKRAYKAVSVPFTLKEWNYNPKNRKNELKKVASRNMEKYRQYIENKEFIERLEGKYNEVINKLVMEGREFTFNTVFEQVENPKKLPHTLFEMFEAKIKELRENEKYGTAETYHGTLNKLKAFSSDKLFFEANSEYLLKFKKSLKKEGLSEASISIHLRNIRAIFNYAISEKVAKISDYPFIKGNKIMKDVATGYRSIALQKHEVDSIRNLKKELPEGSDLWHACNYFLFGYLGRGINFQDIARLKWENIKQGRVKYVRRKTRAKTPDEQSFSITPEIAEILKWYRTHDIQLYNPYIFPVLNASHTTEKSKFNRIKKIRRQVNKDLKTIGKMIGADIEITTYTWRHTFAAVAKNDLKVDVKMISEMLGHHDLKVTEHYLKQFPDSEKDKAVAGL